METANNLDEAKPIQPINTLELEVKTEDSVKYLIKKYFEEKENKNKINLPNENKPNIIYSIDNLLNEKEIIMLEIL